MSKLKKRTIIVLICTAAAAAILAVAAKIGNNPVSNVINTVISPAEAAVVRITRPVKNFFTFIGEMKTLKEENELLKSELNTLKKENRSREEYKRENTRLKRLLQLTDDMSNCETVPAKIVSFEQENWFYSVVINKGERDGIKLSDVVISESGLVGKVSEVGYNWARVSTILDADNSIGVKLTRTGDVGIAEGDTELSKKRRLKLDYISKNISLISGDLIETSGLGGVYPPGLSVGTVEEVKPDSTGELTEGTVKPAVDFDNLYEVVVVTYWEPAMYDKNQVMIEYGTDSTTESGRNENSLKTPAPQTDKEQEIDMQPDSNTEENTDSLENDGGEDSE